MSQTIIATILATVLAAPYAVDGGLVINEVLSNPDGYDAGNEAIELWNPGAATIDLSGWSLGDDAACPNDDGKLGPYALNGTIGPGEHLVLSLPRCVSLTNGGDAVFLYDPAGERVDGVCWGDGCDAHPDVASAPVTPNGVSAQRCIDATGTPRWMAGAPTLGEANGC